MVHDMYLAEVKTPQESRKPWDYYKIKQWSFQPAKHSGRSRQANAR
ncbi:hypothetical protein ACU4GD_20730 [Cupriavidus basilensis]